MNEQHDRKNWMIAVGVAALLVLPFLVQARSGSSPHEQSVRAYVADMTDTERQRLERNFEAFQSLTPEERTRLHELHEAVEQDPQLQRVLTAYYEWFKTRSTWERYELRPEEPITNRVERVHALLDREEERRGRLSERWRRMHHAFGPRLSAEDIGPVFKAINQSLADVDGPLPSDFPSTEIPSGLSPELKSLHDHIQTLRQLFYLLRPGALSAPPAWVEPPIADWVAAIQNPELREDLLEHLDNLSPGDRARSFVVKLWFGTWGEYRNELERVRPSGDTRDQYLKEYLLRLDKEKRDYFLSLPPEKYEEELRDEYFEFKYPQLDDAKEDLKTVWDDIHKVWPPPPRGRGLSRGDSQSSSPERRTFSRGSSRSRTPAPSK